MILSEWRRFRKNTDVPFYCNPFQLFFAVWALMLACFQVRVSYTSYPYFSTAFYLFASSACSFLAGYATVRLAYFSIGHYPVGPNSYRIDISKLRRFHLGAIIVTLAIMLMNLKLFGLPPLFGFLGADTLNYQEYGSLRQVLFPAILVLFVSAPLEVSIPRRWALYLYAPACFLIYGSRGYLLIMLFQALVVFSLKTTLSQKKIYLVAAATLGAAVLLANLIGNTRNSLGSEALLLGMRIKHSYYDWPAAYLWVLSYISTPLSNLCWIVHVYPYDHPSFNFLYSALPGFWAPKSLEISDLGSEQIVDGVHTYISKYFIDFWVFGIFGINYVWGLIAGFISAGNRLTRNYLTSAVLLGCMGFMFFSDFLTILIILLELLALGWAQRYFTIEGNEGTEGHTTAPTRAHRVRIVASSNEI
ncbi:O-antigen polymerase [Edaphobacter aggregans]|uniref:O-antigen polymerase n=1 Tax=Edaphobacter aggregans TaxID=570835 RepID=UPI00055189D8|nr:O-antigen polymerase [Edaphobacter aggregans]